MILGFPLDGPRYCPVLKTECAVPFNERLHDLVPKHGCTASDSSGPNPSTSAYYAEVVCNVTIALGSFAASVERANYFVMDFHETWSGEDDDVGAADDGFRCVISIGFRSSVYCIMPRRFSHLNRKVGVSGVSEGRAQDEKEERERK